ncbi:MAG: alanyl-tRNA editing protein [Treponema sp.]|nr:alanyl-tRNA editing protein [Treponema sp.]
MKVETSREYYNFNYSTGTESFEANILEVRPFTGPQTATQSAAQTAILLDKTIFYPEGGGQPSDRGTINGVPVLDVIEQDEEILHLVKDGESKIIPGKAGLVLDRRRRRDFSVCHTGQHLLSGILFRLMNIPTVSMHLGDEACFIDIKTSELGREKMLQAEETAADIIEENRPVIVHLCPPEDISSFPLRKIPPKGKEVIRVLEIQDLDFSPCCGTHLRSTGEIGMLRILGAEKYKGMMRLAFIAGRRCLHDSRLLRDNAEIISQALSVPVKETGRGVHDYMDKTAALEAKLKELKEESNHAKAQDLIKKPGSQILSNQAIIETYKLDMDDVINIGKQAEKLSPVIFILVSENENKFAAFCGNKAIDLRPLLREKLTAGGGKGGGGPSYFQGSFGNKANLDLFFKSLTN